MKRILSFLVLFLFTFFSNGQEPRVDWVISAGEANSDLGRCVVTDADGNVYVTGNFSGIVDFDPSPSAASNLTSNGLNDIFIQKLDQDGNLVWAKSMGGPSEDVAFSLAIDNDGHVLTTGYFSDSADFDPGTAELELFSEGSADAFVCKLDIDGNFIWARSLGGIEYDRGHSVTTDADGNVYSTGYFEGVVDADPVGSSFTLAGNGMQDIYILKLDADGNLIWAKSYGSTGADYGKSIEIDPLGYLYIAGKFEGTVNFNTMATPFILVSEGLEDGFIMKLNLSGNRVWTKSIGGDGDDYCRDVHLTDSGDLYCTGYFSSTADLDPSGSDFSLSSEGGKDVFIEKLDTDGNLLWVRAFGGAGEDIGFSIVTDGDTGVYSCGYFNGPVDFDPSAGIATLDGAGGDDGYITRFSSDGEFTWVGTAGSSEYDRAQSLTYFDEAIFCTGGYSETVDFDPNSSSTTLTSNGFSDIFTFKLHQCFKNTGIDSISSCKPITWIDGVEYSTSESTATYTLLNTEGCDSIITLNLYIPITDITVSEENNILSTNALASTYQWVNCLPDGTFVLIDDATSSTFSPEETGEYTIIAEIEGCSDTAACFFYVNEPANAFSPNGDGINDTFIMNITNSNNTVTFHNRWGDIVQKIEGYNDIEKVWDGKSNLGELSPGTYYFIVEFNDSEAGYSGWVQLLK